MGGLSFSDRARRSMWRIVPKRAVSKAIGWGASRGLPPSVRGMMLSRFARAYGIDLEEAEKPLMDYADFDELFTRRLRAGARPIAEQPGGIVSPADGIVVECGLATAGKLIQAKGTLFELAELLSDGEIATRLVGGAYLITYLSPKDYHRVHSPCRRARHRMAAHPWQPFLGRRQERRLGAGPLRPQRAVRDTHRDGRRWPLRGRHGGGNWRRPRDGVV